MAFYKGYRWASKKVAMRRQSQGQNNEMWPQRELIGWLMSSVSLTTWAIVKYV